MTAPLPTEDWPAALRKLTPVSIPDVYPATVPITALAISPDGAEVVASGYHELTTWKLSDGSPARRFPGMAERIHDIAYSPDGKWMATASGDPGQFGSVQLWIAEPDGGGKLARDLLETTDSVFAVAFSPDGTKLAAAGADRAVRVWEVATGKELALIEDHADWIFDLAWSPDGKRLATASRDKTSKVFDVEKKESIATFPGHAETIYCVSFTPDGKSVVTGGADNQIRVWNPDEDAKQALVVGGFGGAVFRLMFAPDGKTLLACGADKTDPRVRELRRQADPVGPQRLGLQHRPFARRQDSRLRELGRRGPDLEPARRQADPDDPGRAGVQADDERSGIEITLARPTIGRVSLPRRAVPGIVPRASMAWDAGPTVLGPGLRRSSLSPRPPCPRKPTPKARPGSRIWRSWPIRPGGSASRSSRRFTSGTGWTRRPAGSRTTAFP